MLDVHPPHHPTHTWRDFFIHIATIVVGLLIAVGLEQTVEYFHHREQLHRLREELHAEGLQNLHLALSNIDVCESRQTWSLITYREIVSAHRDGRPPVLLVNPSSITYVKPDDAVWKVAQQRGTLGLLPADELQHYVRLYAFVEQAADLAATMNAADGKLRVALAPGKTAFTAEQRNLSPDDQGNAAWATLDADDFREARNALAEYADVQRFGINRSVLLYITDGSIFTGHLRSVADLMRVFRDALAAYRKGGKAALLAMYPLPADANDSAATREQTSTSQPF